MDSLQLPKKNQLPRSVINVTKGQKVKIKAKTQGTESKSTELVKTAIFVEGQIVWAKMKGFPLWPAKVRSSYL